MADYEIRIRGRVSDTTMETFEDFITSVEPAETVMRGEIRDQAELRGLLDQIQALGLELVAVRQMKG